MHEWAIADNLVKLVVQAAKREDLESVSSVAIRIGALQQVVQDSLEMAFSFLADETAIAGARLEIIPVPTELRCRSCGSTTTGGGLIFTCERCGSVDVEIISGKELYIDYLEGEKREGAENDEIRKPTRKMIFDHLGLKMTPRKVSSAPRGKKDEGITNHQ